MGLEIGKRIRGKTRYIPRAMLTESSPGVIYELQIKTGGVHNPKEVVDIITRELPKKLSGLKVLWIRIDSPYITVQIRGSPFAWSALLLILPQVLGAIGIVVLLIAIYLVWSSIPSWAVALLITGALILWGAPKIAGIVTPKEK